MKHKYYVVSLTYTIGGDKAYTELSEYEEKVSFVQSFQRAWSTKFFDSELDALLFLRTMFPDRMLTVLEDTGKVISTFGHKSGLTTMRIGQERDVL